MGTDLSTYKDMVGSSLSCSISCILGSITQMNGIVAAVYVVGKSAGLLVMFYGNTYLSFIRNLVGAFG